MNDASIRAQLNLGPMDQVGFVFRDVEAAMARYAPVFGPFEFHKFDGYDYRYRGREEHCQLWIAFARSGELEIEFIQWVSGGSPHKEFLDAGREGLHHIRFRVPQMEQKVAEAEALGFRAIWQRRFGEHQAVAYLERDEDEVLVELYEDQRDGQ
jgi:catechol 2,3-dioxygenase-like lactoylglutathione lyase family enzyme